MGAHGRGPGKVLARAGSRRPGAATALRWALPCPMRLPQTHRRRSVTSAEVWSERSLKAGDEECNNGPRPGRALLSQRLPQTGVVQSLEVDRAKLTGDEAEPSARRVGKVLLLHLLVSSAASDCAGGRGWTEDRGNSSVRFHKGDCSTCSQHRVLAAHTRCQLRDGQYRRPRVHGARARAWSKRRRRREPRRRARGTVGDSQQLLRARNKRKSARLRQRQHHRSQPSARRTPTSTAR